MALDSVFALSADETNRLLGKAKLLADFVYPDENDADEFMNNPHPATLGTVGTAEHLMTPEGLITEFGQEGYERVENALLQNLQHDPKYDLEFNI